MSVTKRQPRRVEKRVWPNYFDDLEDGKKTFDLRLADFECAEGDTIVFIEYDPCDQKETGRKLEKRVSYVLKTKDLPFWSAAEIAKNGYQVIGLEEPNSRCPNWTCGGRLVSRDVDDPEYEKTFGENTSWQLPELYCTNCHAVFRIIKFEGKQ